MKHWRAVERIYHWLHQTIDSRHKIAAANLELEYFADASYNDCADTNMSTTGFLFRAGGATLSWYSKRQSLWAQSSTEAEFMAQAVASNELVWWRALWDDLGFDPGKMSAAPTGWCDNDGAVRLVESAARFEATKH